MKAPREARDVKTEGASIIIQYAKTRTKTDLELGVDLLRIESVFLPREHYVRSRRQGQAQIVKKDACAGIASAELWWTGLSSSSRVRNGGRGSRGSAHAGVLWPV